MVKNTLYTFISVITPLRIPFKIPSGALFLLLASYQLIPYFHANY